MNEYREFSIPSDDEILTETGLEAEKFGPEPTTRVVRQVLDGDQSIAFSYDVLGRSVRCRWTHRGSVVMDLFREGATVLTFESRDGRTVAATTFETDSLAGEMRVQLYPSFALKDSMLIR